MLEQRQPDRRDLPPLCRTLRGAGPRDLQPAALRVPAAIVDTIEGAAQALGGAHAPAVGRLPRRQLHRGRGADRHDLRALREGHQPQPGGKRAARGSGRRRRVLAAPWWSSPARALDLAMLARAAAVPPVSVGARRPRQASACGRRSSRSGRGWSSRIQARIAADRAGRAADRSSLRSSNGIERCWGAAVLSVFRFCPLSWMSRAVCRRWIAEDERALTRLCSRFSSCSMPRAASSWRSMSSASGDLGRGAPSSSEALGSALPGRARSRRTQRSEAARRWPCGGLTVPVPCKSGLPEHLVVRQASDKAWERGRCHCALFSAGTSHIP